MTWCLFNATLLFTSVCGPLDVKNVDVVSSTVSDIVQRARQFYYQLLDQPQSTLFDPFQDWFYPTEFPAFREWLLNGWREQRYDEILRLHTLPGDVSSDSVYLSFAPILNSNNIVGYLPHNDFEPSFKREDILRLYTNSTSEWENYAFYVDTKTKFLPIKSSAQGSPFVTREEVVCNGRVNDIVKPIRSVDGYLTFPSINAREYLTLHPHAKWVRKLLAAACPAETDCAFLTSSVFTLLFPTDDAFNNLSNEAKAFILQYRPAAESVLFNHILGAQAPYSSAPSPSYWYIDQIRDGARVNGTLYLRVLSAPHNLLGAYDWGNGFKFRTFYDAPEITTVANCGFAYAQFPNVDIETKNALIHKVNNVLLPSNVVANLTRNGISNIYTGCPQPIARPNFGKISGKDYSTQYGEHFNW